jgi:hypothetical protein
LRRRKGVGTRSTLVNSILAKINQERQNKYEEFVKFVKADISLNSSNIFITMTT